MTPAQHAALGRRFGALYTHPAAPSEPGYPEVMIIAADENSSRAKFGLPAGENFLQQQARFDDFIDYFNHERPHQALAMKTPAERYQSSPRPYRGLAEIDYPFHDKTVTVTTCGRICIRRKKVNLSPSSQDKRSASNRSTSGSGSPAS